MLLKIRYGILLLFIAGISSCSTSSFFYYPNNTLQERPDTKQYRYEEITFNSVNGKQLHGWFIQPKSLQNIRGTIIHFHGNSANISHQYQAITPLVDNGFQAFVFDYQGYGNSAGTPSQENILEDGLATIDYVADFVKGTNSKIILFGQSLGGHLAVVVAAQRQDKIDGMVIEGAFDDHERIAASIGFRKFFIPGLITRLFVPTRYDAIDYVDALTMPKLIIHSTEDKVVPFKMGRRLYKKAIEPKEFWEIQGPHIRASKLYRKEFVERFNQLLH